MKKTIKIFVLILMITILVTNISYATNITVENLNESIKELFSKDVKIVTEIKNENGNGTSTRTFFAQDVEVNGNEINITDRESNDTFTINYKIENDVCRFESNVSLGVDENSTEEDAFTALYLTMQQMSNIEICYLAVADALGIELSVAEMYYLQNYTGESSNVQSDVFNIETNLIENNSNNVVLEIDLLQLSELDTSKIDNSYSCTITIGNQENDSDGDEADNTKEKEENDNDGDEVDNTKEKEENDNDGDETDNKQEETENIQLDSTQAQTNMPKTGSINIVYCISFVASITIILFVKFKTYKEIK